MHLVFRSAVVVKAKQPLVDWINSLYNRKRFTLEEVAKSSNIIFLPAFANPEECSHYIEFVYDIIFEWELLGWWMDKHAFPQDRTYDMFKEWFDVEVHTDVFDLADEGIERKEIPAKLT